MRPGCKARPRYASLHDTCRYCLARGSYTVCTEVRPGWIHARRACWRHIGAQFLAMQHEEPFAIVYVTRARTLD
jgi:hypothetical protein